MRVDQAKDEPQTEVPVQAEEGRKDLSAFSDLSGVKEDSVWQLSRGA